VRITELINAFSRKLETMECAVALHFMHYNFARKYQPLKGKTHTMAAGVADHAGTGEAIAALLSEK
jgi:hypothetical protein